MGEEELVPYGIRHKSESERREEAKKRKRQQREQRHHSHHLLPMGCLTLSFIIVAAVGYPAVVGRFQSSGKTDVVPGHSASIGKGNKRRMVNPDCLIPGAQESDKIESITVVLAPGPIAFIADVPGNQGNPINIGGGEHMLAYPMAGCVNTYIIVSTPSIDADHLDAALRNQSEITLRQGIVIDIQGHAEDDVMNVYNLRGIFIDSTSSTPTPKSERYIDDPVSWHEHVFEAYRGYALNTVQMDSN